MRFRILGPLEVHDGERALALGGVKRRAVLALLLLDANRSVAAERLVDGVWGEDPPASARESLRNHVQRLRRELGSRLLTRPGGYELRAETHELDLLQFARLVTEARAAEPEEAADLLRQALALWRGPVLADLTREPVARLVAHLDELRVGALEDRIEADLGVGRHAELVPELEELVLEHPLRERPVGQLMLALYRSGRQADALAAYERIRLRLDRELGTVPGGPLRELHGAILRQQVELRAPAAPALEPAPEPVRELRRTVTVLAADLADARLAGDPEARRAAVGERRQAVAATLRAHGGTVILSELESMLAAFGVPAAHDDDALRAVRAAFELTRAQTASRVGLATGEVIAGAGPAGAAAVSGTVPGEAARLRDAADPGCVLAAERTWRLVRHAVAAERLPRGWRLTSLDEEAPALLRRLETPLVGRELELRRALDAFANAVRQQRAQLLTVFGEPGVGKTRLATEAAARLAEQATVLRASCRPYGQQAYGPLQAVVAELGDVDELLADDRDGALAAERVAGAVEAGAGAGSPEEVAWAFRRLLEAAALSRPLVLVVEDVHWASASLLDLLEHVVELARRPILVLCLARPDLLEARPGWAGGKLNASSILLDALDEEEAEALLGSLIGFSSLPEATEARILTAAGGNPLFLEQLLAAALEERTETLPDELQALLATRLDRLEPRARAVVEAGSVAGEEFTTDDVERLAGEDVRPTLETLVRRELIRPLDRGSRRGEAWAFRHVLIREAAYGALPKTRRAALHEALAAGAREDEVIGYHLERAAAYLAELKPDDARARELGLAAAERLYAAGMRAYERTDMAAARPLLGRAAALYPAGTRERDAALYRLATAHLWAGEAAAAGGALAEARAAAAARGDEATLARVLLVELQATWFGERPASAQDLLADVDAAAAVLERVGDEEGLAEACFLRFHGLSSAGIGKPPDAAQEETLEHGLRHARAAGARSIESDLLGWRLIGLRRGIVPVTDAIAQATRIHDEASTPSVRAGALGALSMLHAMQGRFSEGRELARESERLLAELGLSTAVAAHAIARAEIELLAGDLAEAERILREGEPRVTALGDSIALANLAWELALVLARQGRDEEALDWEHRADVAGGSFWVAVWRLVVRALVLARRGEREQAGGLVEEALAAVEGVGDGGMHADVKLELAEAVALLDGDEAARALLADAAGVAERLGYTVARDRALSLRRRYEVRTA